MRSTLLLFVAFLVGCGISLPDSGRDPLSPDRLTVPDGFRVDVFADQLPEARSMTLAEDGTLFVGQRDGDAVYALRDTNDDGHADSTFVVDSGLDTPNGVAVRDGDLYVAEISRILRYDDVASRVARPPAPRVLAYASPSYDNHCRKSIALCPDGSLYVPYGPPDEMCD
jgi:glucose/arabinose dehydrogenase